MSFYPPNNPKNQNFEKIKKASGDVTILHVCQKSQSYDVYFLRYGDWQTIVCHFGPIFALLPHYWLWKLKFGNVKKPGYVILLQMCTINEDHMM